jgi:hypothetical protein
MATYEEEDTCMATYEEEDTCMATYEEEDTCMATYTAAEPTCGCVKICTYVALKLCNIQLL